MARTIHNIAIAAASLLFATAPVLADQTKSVLDVKNDISDSNIIFPESYELDTQKMMEGWYLKNYTATDDRYRRQGDTDVSDQTIRERLSQLNTVIEMPFNQIVRSYIDRYTDRSRAQVSALLGLSIYYMPIFEQALEEAGLPLELKYLPVIESGLNPNAVSKHGAAGLWQFMLATGKGMDLEVSSLVDERRDPYKSSQKAAAYLKDLYSTYGDWSLAIAAYNCGPGTVNKAIRRAGGDPSDHDFWSIYYFLPAETRGYVPMFIAANYVMTYYPYHNISPVLATKPLVTDTLMISDRVHFNQISKVLDIPLEELRVLNPQFRADLIPGRPEKMYTLVLPSQQCHAYIMSEKEIKAYEAERYAQRLDAEPGAKPGESVEKDIEQEASEEMALLAQESATPLEQPAASEPAPIRKPGAASATATVSHKVEPGETLSAIASKYGVSVDEIKQWNDLARNTVRTGQLLRISTTPEIAARNGARETAPARQVVAKKPDEPATTQKKNADKKTGGNAQQKHPAQPASHTVKSGENLSTIAKKYNTTVAELKKANNLSSDALHPGDALKIPAKGNSTQKSSVSSKKSGSGATASSKSKASSKSSASAKTPKAGKSGSSSKAKKKK